MTLCANQARDLFFSLKTWDELKRFVEGLDFADPFQKALQYYARTWDAPAEDANAFEPDAYVSEDLSAIHLYDCPVIFQGTNQWAEKCYMSPSYYEQRLGSLLERCQRFRDNNPKASITVIMIPEKDTLISLSFLKEKRFFEMIEAARNLRSQLAAIGVQFIFEQSLSAWGEYMSIGDFSYADSHLHPRNYIVIFSHALRAMGRPWEAVSPSVRMTEMPVYLDLSTKFRGGEDLPVRSLEIDFVQSAVEQVSGSKSFEHPLGSTAQEFINLSPVFPEDVLILGDSHSSIFSQRRLTYLFANTFKSTSFSWNPCGIRNRIDKADFDHIVLETSSRFVI